LGKLSIRIKTLSQALPEVQELRELFAGLGFITHAEPMTAVLQRAYKAAQVSDATVLLQGETGSGKQVLARAIHSLDRKRHAFPFITLNCSTLSEGLAESELFGHRKGSFSGAAAAREGLFQAAKSGTVFLDDVNDLPLRLQPKLLDVLQRGFVRPLGADLELAVHARVIAAANRPLEPLVEEGSFRADLFHRLNVIRVCLPPLRDRRDDLEPLILEFARRHSSLHGPIEYLEPDLIEYLRACRFDGNVRELENAVQRMLFNKGEGSSFTRQDWLEQEMGEGTHPGQRGDVPEAADLLWLVMRKQDVALPEMIRQIERELLQRALQMQGKTRRDLARVLHTSERTLYHKISSHGIAVPDRRAAS
jgi:transcriptional regulator with GAF, ATPase, and Fis domain